jgi:hypothetical protein
MAAVVPPQKVIILEEQSTGAKWARETTLKEILEKDTEANDYLKLLTNKFAKKELDIALDEAKQNKKKRKNDTDAFKDLNLGVKNGFDKVDGSLRGALKGLHGAISDIGDVGIIGMLAKHSGTAAASLSKLGAASEDLLGGILTVAGPLLLLAGGVFETYQIVTKLNNEYYKLFDSGVRFSDGLAGMTQTASDLGISLDNLVSSFTEYSADIAFLGTDKVTRLGKSFKLLNEQTGALQLTNQDAIDSILEFTDMLRVTGGLSGKTTKQLTDGTAQYIQELNMISSITGKNRKTLEKEAKDRAKDLDMNVAISNLSANEQDAIRRNVKSLSALGDSADDAQKILTGIYAGTGIAKLDSGLQLLMTRVDGLSPAFDQLSIDLKSNAANAADLVEADQERIGKLTNSPQAKEYAASLHSQAMIQGIAGDAARKAIKFMQDTQNVNETGARIQEEVNKRLARGDEEAGKRLTREQLEARERAKMASDANKDAIKLRNTQNKAIDAENTLKNSFDRFLIESLNPALPALGKLADGAIKVSVAFSDILTTLAHPIDSLANLFTTLGDAIDELLISFGLKTRKQDPDAMYGKTGSESNLTQENLKSVATTAIVSTAVLAVANKLTGGVVLKGLRPQGIKDFLKDTQSTSRPIKSTGSLNPFSSPESPRPFSMPGVEGAAEKKAASKAIAEAEKKAASKAIAEAEKKAASVASKAGGLLSKVGGLGTVAKVAGEAGLAVIAGKFIGEGISAVGNKILPDAVLGAVHNFREHTAIGKMVKGLGGLLGETSPEDEQRQQPPKPNVETPKVEGDDSVNQLKKFETLTDPLTKVTPALTMFSTAFKTVTDSLISANSANINTDAIIKTITNLAGILYTDIKTGMFSGKTTIASKITELGDSLGSVNIADKLNQITPSLSTFSTAFNSAISSLNSAKIDASVNDTLTNLSNLLYTSKQDTLFSGKITTSSMIEELAKSVGDLAANAQELANPSVATNKGGAKLLSPSDLQKITIDFYDNQRSSNASMIELLQMINYKLEALGHTTNSSTSDIVNAVKKQSGRVY